MAPVVCGAPPAWAYCAGASGPARRSTTAPLRTEPLGANGDRRAPHDPADLRGAAVVEPKRAQVNLDRLTLLETVAGREVLIDHPSRDRFGRDGLCAVAGGQPRQPKREPQAGQAGTDFGARTTTSQSEAFEREVGIETRIVGHRCLPTDRRAACACLRISVGQDPVPTGLPKGWILSMPAWLIWFKGDT